MKNILSILLFASLAVGVKAQKSTYDIIKIDSCPGTEITGEPELFVGDNLFDLINGGAELYHEFGFVEVLAAKMAIPGGDPLKVEIYDMGSPESAWGIYSLTTTSNASPFHAGAEGRHGEGFSQFVKGNYMVYFYYDHAEATEIQYVAGCLSQNIKENAARPAIMKALDKAVPDADKTIYFKGNLGLSSVYSFHYKDIFNYAEGAAAIAPDEMVFLFRYKDETSCTEHFNKAREFFMNSSKYHDPIMLRGSFHAKDRKERQIDCYLENDFLVLFVSSGGNELDELREKIVHNMDKL